MMCEEYMSAQTCARHSVVLAQVVRARLQRLAPVKQHVHLNHMHVKRGVRVNEFRE
jgi:hypothetical protein